MIQNIESIELKGSMIIVVSGVAIHWTGLLDWTTGLPQNGIKCLLHHVYSAYFFATFAPLSLACWANFTGVSRGQGL